MTRKPWPILVLALFQWLSPMGDAVVSAVASHLSLGQYLKVALSEQGFAGYFFHSWVPALLAGFAVYRVRPWSFPVFFGCLLYSSYRSLHSGWMTLVAVGHLGVTQWGGLALWGLSLLSNLGIGAWLLLPGTSRLRKPFFNRSLRWWEAAARYTVTLPAQVYPALDCKEGASVELRNLSRGGALLEIRGVSGSSEASGLKPGDTVLLGFCASFARVLPRQVDQSVAMEPWVFSEARVVHRASAAGGEQVGVEFCGMSWRSRGRLRNFLSACRLLEVPSVREETGIFSDLNYWWEQWRAKQQESPSEVEKRAETTPEAEPEIKAA